MGAVLVRHREMVSKACVDSTPLFIQPTKLLEALVPHRELQSNGRLVPLLLLLLLLLFLGFVVGIVNGSQLVLQTHFQALLEQAVHFSSVLDIQRDSVRVRQSPSELEQPLFVECRRKERLEIFEDQRLHLVYGLLVFHLFEELQVLALYLNARASLCGLGSLLQPFLTSSFILFCFLFRCSCELGDVNLLLLSQLLHVS
mmetsp:Transcript_18337/g.35903  ORF Transcript_18337/g.35903 Transcript_18337/m.35903 type:complete len:200 (+) Transcript_18337:671-1270(+)